MLLARRQRGRRTYSHELRDHTLTGGMPRALLLGAAGLGLLLVGVGVGRATSAPAPAPAAAAATTTVPQAALGAAGGRTLRANVRTGWEHSERGATAAATEYSNVLTGAMLTDPTAYSAAVAVLAAPESASMLAGQAHSTVADMQHAYGVDTAAATGTVVVRSVPLAWHVQEYSSDRATVQVWLETMLGESGRVAPVTAWETATYTLRWVDGDWRLVTDSFAAGPTPTSLGSPAAASVLPPQFGLWTQYGAASS